MNNVIRHRRPPWWVALISVINTIGDALVGPIDDDIEWQYMRHSAGGW